MTRARRGTRRGRFHTETAPATPQSSQRRTQSLPVKSAAAAQRGTFGLEGSEDDVALLWIVERERLRALHTEEPTSQLGNEKLGAELDEAAVEHGFICELALSNGLP